jgi:hypothetical protein
MVIACRECDLRHAGKINFLAPQERERRQQRDNGDDRLDISPRLSRGSKRQKRVLELTPIVRCCWAHAAALLWAAGGHRRVVPLPPFAGKDEAIG